MKVTKDTTGYVCDFCGADCTEEHMDIMLPRKTIIIPIKSDGLNGLKMTYTPQQKNLCLKCAGTLSDMVDDFIKDFCASNNYSPTIKHTIESCEHDSVLYGDLDDCRWHNVSLRYYK